jgi:hypothetical protein
MQKSYNVYNNLGYWFLAFIVLIFWGFYPTYFAVIFQPMRRIVHVHFFFMALWVVMLIVQPFLIKYKKNHIHRTIGKLSYFVAPAAMITGYLMLRNNYYGSIDRMHQEMAEGKAQYKDSDILIGAASSASIAMLYLTWFVTFYTLAIRNRRNMLPHSRYMLACALLMLGPSLDRVLFNTFYAKYPFRYDLISFFIQDIVIAALMIRDFRKKKRTRALAYALVIFVTGQLSYYYLTSNSIFATIAKFIMKPAP